MTIIETCRDGELFGRWFRDRATWAAWFTYLAALFGLPMTEEQVALYHRCTGRSEPPPGQASESWLICGRRAGDHLLAELVDHFERSPEMRPEWPFAPETGATS